MGIPTGGFNFPLSKTTPTKLTPETLQKQLNNIGLNCGGTHTRFLEQYINSVKHSIKDGKTQSMGIYDGNGQKPMGQAAAAMLLEKDSTADTSTLKKSSEANWAPGTEVSAYIPKLEYIQYAEHFNWLKSPEGLGTLFGGLGPTTNNYSGTEATVGAIKTQFVQLATNASAILVNGLDKTDIESVFSNAIAPVTDSNASNYDKKGSKVIFLVDNYDPATQQVDGFGVLTADWHLTISDYKVKKQSPKHAYTLEITVWAVLYYNTQDCDRDYSKALAKFGSS